MGLKLPPILGQSTNCLEGDICKQWGSVASFSVKQIDSFCSEIKWTSDVVQEFQDCFAISKDTTKWFGGPEEYYQHFPMDGNAVRESVPYLPGDMLQDKDKYFGGVAEPYWLSSKGVAIWVPEGVSLFYSWNSSPQCVDYFASFLTTEK